MKEITKDLYQFSVYIPPMDFTIHQYLLNCDPAILFAAGTVQQAQAILPDLKKILKEKPLKYVFVSHMESDEAGGLNVLQKEWPDLKVICGQLCARELPGFGYNGEILAEKAGQEVNDGDLSLQFFDYPSEVHLQNGLLAYEKNTGIFYSADLFLRYGNDVGRTIQADWKTEVDAISEERVPNADERRKLQETLKTIKPSFAAVGHGYCVDCQ